MVRSKIAAAMPAFVPCWTMLTPLKLLDRRNTIALSLIAPELIRHTSAAPVAVEPPWGPEPTGRGTVGLALPCFITLGLCVWTAVHLNVVTDPSRWRLFAMKAAWAFLGIFTPEIVLWVSVQQYFEARSVQAEIQSIRDELRPESVDEAISMRSASFIVMGGYVLDVAPEDRNVLPLTIPPKTFIALYKEGKIQDPVLDAKHMDDKTKAGAVGKFVVCIQTLVGLSISSGVSCTYVDDCSGLLFRG